jgi:hypothetical protein
MYVSTNGRNFDYRKHQVGDPRKMSENDVLRVKSKTGSVPRLVFHKLSYHAFG